MESKSNPISKSYRIKVGITMGDPSGIGPNLIVKVLSLYLEDKADFVVIGDRWVFDKAKSTKLKAKNYKFIDLNNVKRKDFAFGKIKTEYGRAAIQYLDRALGLIADRKIDCLVTAPICKEAINLAGLSFSGHTEYFISRTGIKDIEMMLLNQDLRFVLATRHIALKDVSAALDKDRLYQTIKTAYFALKRLFLIPRPRMIVCALNPHASDHGLIGDEEAKIIQPAIEKFQANIGGIVGPLPADVAIAKAKDKKYDCLIAMYHDQALIPLKITNFASGINLTLGMPFVRTSPLHGTAFDIAAKFTADSSPFLEAIKVAIECTLNLKRA